MPVTPSVPSSTYTDVLIENTTELLHGRIATGQLIANSVGDMGGQSGNTIKYHRAPKATVQNASDGSAKTYATPVGSTDELTLNFYKEAPLSNGDLNLTITETDTYSGPELQKYADSASKVLATQIDQDVLEKILDDPNIGDASVIGNPSNDLNDNAFRQLSKDMVIKGQNLDDVFILLNPEHTAQAMGLDVFRQADYNSAKPQIDGNLPLRVYGMNIYTNIVNLPKGSATEYISGSSASEKVSVALTPESGKFVMPRLQTPSFASNNANIATSSVDGLNLRLRSWYDPSINTSRLVVDGIYGAAALKQATTQGSDVVPATILLGGTS